MIEFPDKPVEVPQRGRRPALHHVYDEDSIWAIRGALASNRPLLVRGQPGVGKTQLARAAAVSLNRPIVEFTVDSKTESQDLLWSIDNIRRLAEAQVIAASQNPNPDEQLNILNFANPGPIWWAFDWKTAEKVASKGAVPEKPEKWNSTQDGVVLLIDEIDKGDSDVPNGLLEALGNTTFRHPDPDQHEPVALKNKMPLVVITTNEERALPDAFVRRCLVLNMSLPRDNAALKKVLRDRGRAHFPKNKINDAILGEAADFLIDDRNQAKRQQVTPLPGQAEFIDMLNAIKDLKKVADKRDAMKKLRAFVFQKHADVDE